MTTECLASSLCLVGVGKMHPTTAFRGHGGLPWVAGQAHFVQVGLVGRFPFAFAG